MSGAPEVGVAASLDEVDGAMQAARPAGHRGASGTLLGGLTAIWVRELRGRMRGKRAFIFLTFYLFILVGLLWATVGAATSSRQLGALESISLGRGIFGGVVFVETLVVIVLSPAYTAASISQEREKQTFDLLAVTPISSLAIVLGKLVSGLSFLAVIVGASLPLASLAFLFGGIGPEDLLAAYFVLAILGLGAGAIGIFCSAVMKRTQPATVAAFVGVALVTVGTAAIWIGLEARADEDPASSPPEAILYLNPFVAQADVVCAATGALCVTRPDRAIAQPQPVGPANGVVGPGVPPPLPDLVVRKGGDLWPKSVAAWLIVTAILIGAAAQGLSPTRRWRLQPGRALPTGPDSVPR